jgi:hypothetical protein
MTTCPKCGSRFLRPAHPRNLRERLDRLRFIDPLRCLDCKTRFIAKTMVWSNFFFARCPQCRRMDLNIWTGKTYEPPWFMNLRIDMGARRFRCEYCRLNFASFKKRKEVFSFSRWKKLGFGSAEQGQAEQEGDTPVVKKNSKAAAA